jgi:hypothetical protein
MSIKRIASILLFFLSLSYGYNWEIIDTPKTYIDLGVSGNLYDIKEENFISLLKSSINDYQKSITKDEIRKKVLKQMASKVFYKSDLGVCQKEMKKAELNEYIVPMDIRNPTGRLWKKKGDKILVKNPIPFTLCFIKSDSAKNAISQIKAIDILSSKLSPRGCEAYLVSGVNITKLNKALSPRMFFASSKEYEKLFDLKCYPSLVHFRDDKRFIFNFKPIYKTDKKEFEE